METPPTPEHVRADEEVEVPSGPISLDLDLNPDLEDGDENNENPFTKNTPQETPLNTPANTRNETPAEDDGVRQIPENHSENDIDISQSRFSILLWTLPFDEAFSLLKKQFSESAKHGPISLSQQSKFINYIDGELLQIQRKFIKNQSELAITYSVSDLIADLSPVIDLIWFLLQDHESLFGQDEYYIKILGDLDDWMTYYTFPNLESRLAEATAFSVKLFDFIQKIDTQVSFLIDGYDALGEFTKMSATALVRLSPIVMRLRLTIVEKFDFSRAKLYASRDVAANDELLNILDVEIGRLFEGILERI
ncbi:Subunit 11 of the general transcription factor TFIIH [Metschnikowia aff. pulcherrima]|uniref:Subunit 11 of the general transcription factor TFIIH n=1 Tax=Metschnikowia aff. pulcherrima TaxID=2163413 RepID=A0A4V1ADH2_9ASCO|nr:Subunit 11 of the general transcription factor TFIIH [Metschnikowia aff. pulcherrima]